MVLNLFITTDNRVLGQQQVLSNEIFRIKRVECVSSKWKFCQISNKKEMNFISLSFAA